MMTTAEIILTMRNLSGGTGSIRVDAITFGQDHIRALVSHIDAQAAEIERLRDELDLCCQLKREYQEQAK